MSNIDTSAPVGQLIVANPQWARIFDQFKIDYCCGGNVTLADACLKRKLELHTVVEALLAVNVIKSDNIEFNLMTVSIQELVNHIQKTYHEPLHQDLPYILKLLSKVVKVHKAEHNELIELETCFIKFSSDLETHMQKEEQVLFPMCIGLETAKELPSFHCGSIKNPIAVMMAEHDNAGADLAQMRELTANYTLPHDACNSYVVLYEKLEQIENDMNHHVHIENNILFPRVKILETKLQELSLTS